MYSAYHLDPASTTRGALVAAGQSFSLLCFMLALLFGLLMNNKASTTSFSAC